MLLYTAAVNSLILLGIAGLGSWLLICTDRDRWHWQDLLIVSGFWITGLLGLGSVVVTLW